MTLVAKQSTQLKVKVIPNAKQTQLAGRHGDFIKIKIAAVPDKGKANKELINYLAKTLSVSQSEISIIRGHKNNRKTLKLPSGRAKKLLG